MNYLPCYSRHSFINVQWIFFKSCLLSGNDKVSGGITFYCVSAKWGTRTSLILLWFLWNTEFLIFFFPRAFLYWHFPSKFISLIIFRVNVLQNTILQLMVFRCSEDLFTHGTGGHWQYPQVARVTLVVLSLTARQRWWWWWRWPQQRSGRWTTGRADRALAGKSGVSPEWAEESLPRYIPGMTVKVSSPFQVLKLLEW